MIIARQSTARTMMVGPVLDASGVAVTDCVIADFEGSVNGGDPAALNGSATLTHRGVGFYSLALTATDLGTVGQFEVTINDTTNACPMKEITVVEEAVYDALFAASANAFTGAAGASKVTGVVLVDTLTTYTGNTVQTGDAYARLGAPAGASVSADVAAVKVDTAAILDDTGTAGVVVAAGSKTGYSLTATTGLGNQTANITGNLSGSVGSVTGAVGSVTAAVTLPTIPTNWITADGIATDAIGAAELAADAVTKIQSGLATAANLATVAGYLDTEIAAILTDTNELQTDWANGGRLDLLIDAIKVITDAITTTGSGLSAIPWNASWDAEVQSEVDDALKATLTEGYRSTGAVGSVRDLLYEIIAHLGESAISSTTKTLKKIDGSTTAKTYTLDSAVTPTSITETT